MRTSRRQRRTLHLAHHAVIQIDTLETRALFSSISGSVFADINGDGVQQPGEYNIPQQHVWLDLNHDNAWEPGEPAATTDSAGNYSFSNLSPGTYSVCYYAPPGFRQTPVAGSPISVTVVGNASGIDFGVTPNSTGYPITGSVFDDMNGDGVVQSGDFALANQHLWIDTNNDDHWTPNEPAATTDANGNFTFANLPDGTYTVRYFAPPGFHQTLPAHSLQQTVTINGATPDALSFAVSATPAGSLHIVFDTRYDSSGFFTNNPQALADLNTAAAAYSQFTDRLAAISPGGANSWNETFANPGAVGGPQVTLSNQSVAANTLVVYVGARGDVSGSELGEGGPGGWNASGTQDWLNLVSARGQSGALASTPTDFAPWGGSVTFSANANWNFSTSPPSPSQDDFLSVAFHELAHVLGIGTAASWSALVSGSSFTGANSVAANGGIAPAVDNFAAHFAQGTVSNVNGVSQQVVMEPDILQGSRKQVTQLDYAALQDIGWQVPFWLG